MEQINSNSNQKRKNRKTRRKNHNKFNQNPQSLNNHGDKPSVKENQNGTSKIFEKQSASSPRPNDLGKNNFHFENKRSSGSELDEFHTPTYEYNEPINQKSELNLNKSYENEFEEVSRFNRSNLEGIPEVGNVYNNVPKGLSQINNGHKVSETPTEIDSSSKFKYKQVKQKNSRKPNGDDTRERAVNGKGHYGNGKHTRLQKHEIDLTNEKNKTANSFDKNVTKNILNKCSDNMNRVSENSETKKESNISEHVSIPLEETQNCQIYLEDEISILNNKEIEIVSNHVEDPKNLIDNENPFQSVNEEMLNTKDQNPEFFEHNEPDISNYSIMSIKLQNSRCEAEVGGIITHTDKVNDNNKNQITNIYESPVEDKDEFFNAEEIIKNLDDINENHEHNENANGEKELINICTDATEKDIEHLNMVEDLLKDEELVTNDDENELLMEINNFSSEKSTPNTVIEAYIKENENKLELTPKSENSLKFENLDNILCTDENLQEEILPVTEIKPQNIPESLIKRSMTLGVKPLGNSLRLSATTITNVTSISDENLHLAYEDEFKYMKHDKKRNNFVKTILSKFKKRKINSKMQNTKTKFPSNEEKFPENNEYFDDTSIDCNSHAKGLEIDSNKALKSYDESINNFEEMKPIEVEDCEKFKTVFLDENPNIEEANVSQQELQSKDNESLTDIKFLDNALKPFDTPKHSLEINQSDSDKTSEKLNIAKLPKPESPLEVSKKNNKFTLFSKSNNNKIFSKLKLKHLANEQPRENYKCTSIESTISCKNDDEEISNKIKNDDQDVKHEIERLKSSLIDNISVEYQTEESQESFLPYEPVLCDLERIRDEISSTEDSANDLKDNECETVNMEDQTNDPQELDLDKEHLEAVVDDNSDLINNIEEKSKIPKSKPKRRFLTLFSRKKKDKIDELKRTNSFSDKNIRHKDKENKERIKAINQTELDKELIKEFNNVLNSFPDKEQKVKCKNKNKFPLKLAEENIESKSIQYINDDHMFPDAITPSKIVKFEPEESYNFAFIDDPIIVKQDSLTMFKGENKKSLFFTEFSAPCASLETLFIPEQSQEFQMLEKSTSPTHSFKRPLNGLMNFLSRNR